jgi:predicted TIM-barrel fold metal-dependent hydrolase
MLEVFGEDYCCFGTDTPFSRTDSSLKAVYDAVGEGSDLADKILYRNALAALKLEA